jgi:hypothetical protein
VLALLAATACSRLRNGASPNNELPAEVPARMQLGQRVVVENAMANFVEGTVTELVRDRAQVTLSAGNVLEQGLDDLYVPPEIASSPGVSLPAEPCMTDAETLGGARLFEGGFGVCHLSGGRWRGCRIETLGELVRVTDEEGVSIEVPFREVLAATPVTELNIRQRFERNAKRRVFREGARSAGQPKVPSGWHPAMNEVVLGRRDGAWMAAQVKTCRGLLIRIEWAIDHRLSDVVPADLAPQPPVDFVPTLGTYVLARPFDGASAWNVLRIESAGWQCLALSDEVGDRYDVLLRDVVPLEPGGG